MGGERLTDLEVETDCEWVVIHVYLHILPLPKAQLWFVQWIFDLETHSLRFYLHSWSKLWWASQENNMFKLIKHSCHLSRTYTQIYGYIIDIGFSEGTESTEDLLDRLTRSELGESTLSSVLSEVEWWKKVLCTLKSLIEAWKQDRSSTQASIQGQMSVIS